MLCPFELLVFLTDQLFFTCDLVFLLLNLLVHVLALFLLKVFVLLHVFLEFGLEFLDVVDLMFLLFELVFGRF